MSQVNQLPADCPACAARARRNYINQLVEMHFILPSTMPELFASKMTLDDLKKHYGKALERAQNRNRQISLEIEAIHKKYSPVAPPPAPPVLRRKS